MTYRSVFRPDLFAGQSIIVTGGGSGLGRCMAHELASLGAHLILIGRTREKLENVSAEIIEDGGFCSFYSLDIRDEEGVVETVRAIVKDRGRIHGLVNNAGGQFPAPLATISKKGFDAVVASNLTGGFLMAREVFTQSMANHGGAIVNMLADMWRGMPIMGHSGAARSGMENLTRTAAVEWAVAGVRVNAVAPGWIASSGMDNYKGAINEVWPKLRHSVPLKRIGREAEVSSAVAFLLSEGASFITGVTIRIDGAAMQMSNMWPIPDHNASKPYDGFHRSQLPDILKDTDNK
jgi:citronellol/citronellal dehydrogenase